MSDAPELSPERVSASFRGLVPRDFARVHLLVSQGTTDAGAERIAAGPAADPTVLHNLAVHLDRKIETFLADPERIAQVIDQAYGSAPVEAQHDHTPSAPDALDVDALIAKADRDLLSSQGKGPVVKLVDALLFESLSKGASDVHIQPLEDRTIVRYRLDGMLAPVRDLPGPLSASVVSRVKIMGKMDIAESRIPQDGRAKVTIGDRPIDLRISTFPTSYGERVVIRLLDATRHLTTFDELGMPDDVAAPFLERASRAHGMILLTGPTGSGKTTTLYATLRRIGSPQLNLMTIEDPIEYELSTVGLTISQAQVNERKGVTFATGLRHILRQDPDVIMVGEIRDQETSRVAIQSSLTGHLVLSTLHTNDAASAVTRLIDLGVEPFLVASSLSAVCAQRLVRLSHRACEGRGCDSCLHTGFKGRTGLYELLLVDEAMRELIQKESPLSTLRDAARKAGMRTLHDQGMRLVAEGKTTRAEVERVVTEAELK